MCCAGEDIEVEEVSERIIFVRLQCVQNVFLYMSPHVVKVCFFRFSPLKLADGGQIESECSHRTHAVHRHWKVRSDRRSRDDQDHDQTMITSAQCMNPV